MFSTDAGTLVLQGGCWGSAIPVHYYFVSFNLKVDAFEPSVFGEIPGPVNNIKKDAKWKKPIKICSFC